MECPIPADPQQSYPRCLSGERACLPKGVANAGDYEQYLICLEGVDDFPTFDANEPADTRNPEEFDANVATQRMWERSTKQEATN